MDSSEEEDLAMLAVILIDDEGTKQLRRRRFWIREIFRRREIQGAYLNLLQELKIHDREYFFFFR